MSSLPRITTVAVLSFRGGLRGFRSIALAAIAAVPTLVLLALAAAGVAPSRLLDVSQELYPLLTLRVVVIVVVVVLFVDQFRTEIDDDTLAYLSSRSIPRWGLVVGKYLGSVAGALLLLIPATLAPVAVALLSGAPSPPDGAVAALAAMTVLGTLAYGAMFLFFGLVTSSALLIGLVYGFLWETLLLLVPGSIPRLTIAYYLRALTADVVSTGPLSHLPTDVPWWIAAAGPLLAAACFLALALAIIRYVELAPRRTSA